MTVRVVPLSAAWLETNEEIWASLVHRSGAHPVFLGWAWLWTWWETFGTEREWLLLGCYVGDELVAAAPWCISGKGLGPRRLEFLAQSGGGADYLDVLCLSLHREAVCRALVDWLRAGALRWHHAVFDATLADACISRIVQLLGSECIVRESDSSPCPVLYIRHDWHQYLRARFDKKKRYNLERQVKLAVERDALTIMIDRASADPQRHMDDLQRLHGMRKQRQGIQSAFTESQALVFHRRLAPRLAMRGQVLFATLNNEAGPVAIAYCLLAGKSLCYFQTGFDPAFEKIGAGSVLLTELIRLTFEQEFEEFDFLRGDEPYKYKWTDEQRILKELRILRRTPLGYMVQGMDGAKRMARKLLRRVAP